MHRLGGALLPTRRTGNRVGPRMPTRCRPYLGLLSPASCVAAGAKEALILAQRALIDRLRPEDRVAVPIYLLTAMTRAKSKSFAQAVLVAT